MISAGISSITALSEEFAFRGIIPHVMKSTICNGNILQTYIAQALVFGISHSSRSLSAEEFLVVPTIQFLNALWLGGIYLTTNGDILPCIVAHAVSTLISVYQYIVLYQLIWLMIPFLFSFSCLILFT